MVDVANVVPVLKRGLNREKLTKNKINLDTP